EDLPRQHSVPMLHERYVLTVVASDFLEGVFELHALREELPEVAETTGHGLAPRIDDPGVGEDQVDEADVTQVVRHLVDEERRSLAVDTRILDIRLPHLPEFLGPQVCQDCRVTRRLIRIPVTELMHQPRDVWQLERAVDL